MELEICPSRGFLFVLQRRVVAGLDLVLQAAYLRGFSLCFVLFFSLGWHFLTSGVYFTRCSLARHRCWSLLHYWFSLELRPSNILWQLGTCSIGIMHKQLITKSSKLRTCNKSQDHAKCLRNYICIYTIV